MALRRVFLGWAKPLLHAAADAAIAAAGGFDLSGRLFVLASSRAQRRLLAILAERAVAAGEVLVPPKLCTVGGFAEQLYRPHCPIAGDLARQAAWTHAVCGVEPEQLALLFKHLKPSNDLPGCHSAARVLDRARQEIAAGRMTFAQVADRVAAGNLPGEARWRAAAAMEAAYLRQLGAMELCDLQHAREHAIGHDTFDQPARPVTLIGVPDLSPQARAVLHRIVEAGGGVTALVFAPAELDDTFDELGCVRRQAWNDRAIDLAGVDLRTLDRPADQAQETFAAIARFAANRPLRSDAVSVGVGDESLVPYLRSTAGQLGSVKVRYGAGRPVAETRPYLLLSAVSSLLETGKFAEFAGLVRNPDFEAWLRRLSRPTDAGAGETPNVWRDWRTLLDKYAADFLPDALTDRHTSPEAWRIAPDTKPEKDERPHLAWLFSQTLAFLADLGEKRERKQPASTWALPILQLLARAYGIDWNTHDEAQRMVVESCTQFRDALDELRRLGLGDGERGQPKVTPAEAIRVVLSAVGGCRIPPPSDGDEVELLGWLELPADDADYLVLTGFNEGNVPEPTRPDPLLNETLRQALGLPTARDRHARDAFLLTSLVRSRPAGRVAILVGKWSPQGDPLLPSSLLLRGDHRDVAKRLVAITEPPPRATPLPWRVRPGGKSGFRRGVSVDGSDVVTSMSVTAFRDYLASPQGFYAKHVLGLQTVEGDVPSELGPHQCGQVVHAVLNRFFASKAKDSASTAHVQDAMLSLLHDEIRVRFGSDVPAIVKYQVWMMERRLELLAGWQADWARQGWRTRQVEWSPATDAAASLVVDGQPMGLRGRIDRIDFHPGTGEWALLDYKVGAYKTPKSTHLSGDEWVDLQLPLYRHLATPVTKTRDDVRLGYVCIGDRADEITLVEAGWDYAALESADSAAFDVVRDVRAGRFDGLGDNPPADGMFGFLFGVDLLDTGEADEAEADAEGVES